MTAGIARSYPVHCSAAAGARQWTGFAVSRRFGNEGQEKGL